MAIPGPCPLVVASARSSRLANSRSMPRFQPITTLKNPSLVPTGNCDCRSNCCSRCNRKANFSHQPGCLFSCSMSLDTSMIAFSMASRATEGARFVRVIIPARLFIAQPDISSAQRSSRLIRSRASEVGKAVRHFERLTAVIRAV